MDWFRVQQADSISADTKDRLCETVNIPSIVKLAVDEGSPVDCE